MAKMRAISIRQPWAERILRGEKTIEYRSTNCRKLNERVYIYAAPKVEAKESRAFLEMGLEPGDLRTRVLVGTIEFTNCTGHPGKYEWHIKNPQRLSRPRRPRGKPQPIWFVP